MIIKRSWIFFQFIILLGVLITKIRSECVPLTTSKACPGFASYSIDTTNGKFPLNAETPHYTDVTSFDSYVLKYSEFLAKHYAAELSTGSTCDLQAMENYATSNLRYLTTFACNFIIISKENTCQTVKPKVCKSTCNEFASSFQGLINQFNTCLDQNVVSQNVTTHNSRCTKDTSYFSGDSNCVDASNESNCGFSNQQNASSYCSSSSDACCSSITGTTGNTGATGATGATTGTSNTVNDNVAVNANESNLGTSNLNTAATATNPLTAATSTNKVANVDNATNPNKEQNESKSSFGSKLWIIIGGICVLLVVCALAYFYKKGESLDKNNNSFYEQENKFPPFQPSMTENRGFNSSGYSSQPSNNGYGGNNYSGNNFSGNNYNDTNDVLLARNDMNNMKKNDDIMDDFNFGGDTNNYNFTSNVTPNNNNNNNNNGGFTDAALYAGAGAAAVGGAALVGAAMTNNNNNKQEQEVPQPQMVNMTNIQPPESQDTKDPAPLIKIDDEPQPQMVNMTNIQPPESQDRNESDQPPEIKIDEEPKAQMVNMTEIPEPEVQQNRNTKFLSTYSEAPSNQRISSQYYGESETSYDFSSSKLNIPSQLDNKTLSMASSAMNSNRMSSSTDRELNSTPYRAVHTYEPQLNDELLLEINDVVEVVYIYDDGWVWGINTRTNESGACPMLCLEKIEGESEADFSIDGVKSILSTRESMISRDSVPGRRDSRILKIDGINK